MLRPALVLMLLAPSAALAQTAEPREACLLAAGGRKIIEGACLLSPIGEDGSFQIASPDGALFAQVLITGEGTGDGYWNGTAGAGHAHDPLGSLRRTGGCWIGETAILCVW